MTHLFLHFLVPAIVSFTFFPKYWKKAILVMYLTMLVDLDHLLATPIYDPNRCSIGFHPLHEIWLVVVYLGLCFHKKTRLIGIGLVIHMILDSIDCQVNLAVWYV